LNAVLNNYPFTECPKTITEQLELEKILSRYFWPAVGSETISESPPSHIEENIPDSCLSHPSRNTVWRCGRQSIGGQTSTNSPEL